MEFNKYGKLCLGGKALMSVIPNSSFGHHNKCDDYENDNNKRQEQKIH